MDGGYVVADSGLGALVLVAQDGARGLLYGGVDRNGSVWTGPEAIARLPDGDLVVADVVRLAVVRLDPSGRREKALIAAGHLGNGPGFRLPQDLAVEPGGTVIVVDTYLRQLIRVDPKDGRRRALGGRGPSFVGPFGVRAVGEALYVTDPPARAMLRVDPATGDRTLLDGGGPRFRHPAGLAVLPDGALAVADPELGAVFRVDPRTGDRSLLVAPGGALGTPVSVEADGPDLLIVDNGNNGLYRVRKGKVALVSGQPAPPRGEEVEGLALFRGAPAVLTEDGVKGLLEVEDAVGPAVVGDDLFVATEGELVSLKGRSALPEDARSPGGLSADGDGLLLVSNVSRALMRYDGSRWTLLSHEGRRGTGEGFLGPARALRLQDGSVCVSDEGRSALIRVDPSSGDRTVLSRAGVRGAGPAFLYPGGLVQTPDGALLVTDEGADALLRVDPATGDRSVVAQGPPLEGPLAVVLLDDHRALVGGATLAELRLSGSNVRSVQGPGSPSP